MVKGKSTNDDNISTGGDSSKPTKSSDYDKLQTQKPNQDVKKDVYIDGETEESFKYKIECIEKSESIDKLSLDALPLVQETSYYFVCYSHYDYKNVYKDILLLQQEGLSIWYDRGMPAGQNWVKVANDKISNFNCKGVIFYISKNALKSDQIHKEIKCVKKSGKSFLSINLPIEDKESGSSEVKSAIDILEIVQPNISHDDPKWKDVEETFDPDVIYLKYSYSSQRKCEQILGLKRQELLSYRILDDDYVAVSAINDINATSIEIPANWADELGKERTVSVIGDCAFANCRKLENVVLNCESVSIGKFAFYNCWLLKSLDWKKVKEIYEYAFSGCSSLNSIKIPSHALNINGGMFENCSRLTSIIISASVTNINYYAFNGCSGLTSIIVDAKSDTFASHQGILMDKLKTQILFVPKLISGEVVLPKTLRSIESMAFNGCRELTSITIPASVTSIGNEAFAGTAWYNNQANGVVYAGKVAYVYKGTMPQNTTIALRDDTIGIADDAFYNCSELTSITMPASVTHIGHNAFSGCSGLTTITIPNSVTHIGQNAFSGCSGLASVIIPSSVTSIEMFAFSGCSGLTSITIPNSVKSIWYDTFYNCSGLTSVTIPNSVTSIGHNSFSGCSGLTSVIIPSSVTSIEMFAFSGCSGLTSITIPDSVTRLGIGAFEGCSGLTSIIIPSSVKSIEMEAFKDCDGLTSITIGSGVTSISGFAFAGCTKLATINCEAESQPSGWDKGWKDSCDNATVVGGYTGK